MRPIKIVIIGAGSVSFGPGSLRDAIQCKELNGSKLVLVDLNKESLELVTSLAHRMNQEAGTGLVIESTIDRRQALNEADFVITSVAVNRDELWMKDWEIPIKHGIKQVLGENGGPGGLSHTLRNIPIILDICRDMEELCPKAWLINFTNPESRICMAVNKYTSIKVVGLCHGVYMGRDRVAEIMGRNPGTLDVKAAGVNHLLWLFDIRDKETGEDLYPELRKMEALLQDTHDQLTRTMFRSFGYWPSPSDDHIGEYLPYAAEFTGLEGYNFKEANLHREKLWEDIRQWASGEKPLGDLLTKPSGEKAFALIIGIVENRNTYIEAVNIPNNGCITNLPKDAIVEVPALVSGYGIQGLTMGELPEGIASLCRTQVAIQKLAVEAAVSGDRGKALQALLIDPVVGSFEAAEKTLNELLDVHKAYLPNFF
jgi:alpha-galactosidase